MNSLPRFLFAAAALSVASLSAQARIDRTVEKVFTVSPDGSLHVSTQGGYVHLTVATGDKATVTAHERIRADSEAEADELLSKYTLTIEQNGSDISAISEHEHGLSWNWGPAPVTVNFDVAVPAKFMAEVKTSGGDITVTDRAGDLKLRTSGGNISMGNVTASIDARTSGGDIVLESASGEVELHTSGGDVKVGPIAGGSRIYTSGGTIRIKGTGAPMVAETSGGDITDDFSGPLKGDVTLSTSGGEVKVNIDPKSSFQLDASTSGGSVKAHGLTITIEDGGSGHSRLRGSVNGSGPMLKLHSSGGDIAVITDGVRRL